MWIDFTSEAFFRDPQAGVAQLRAIGPAVATKFPIIGRVWVTTTYEAAARVLKDGTLFTLRKEGGALVGLPWWMPKVIGTVANNMLTMDEPDHTRLRNIVDEAFRRRAVLDMEPHIRAIADRLADELFAAGSPADLVQRYARMLPLAVICELLGLPPADRPKFIAWANSLAHLTNAFSFLRLIGGLFKMRRYLQGRLQVAREQGGEGLIAELVRVEKEGGRITPDEMVSMVFLLLNAGSETTTHLISGSVFELAEGSGPARLARGGLEPRRAGGRRIFALRLAGAILKAALCAPGCRSRGRETEEGRPGHGDDRRRQSGPGSE